MAIKELRKFFVSPWRTLASILGLFTVVSWIRHMPYPSRAVAELLNWLGINSTWPRNVHEWINDPSRHHDVVVMLYVVLALLLLSHARHAWRRADDDDFLLGRHDGDDREERLRELRQLSEYNSGRSMQTYASLWIALTMCAEAQMLNALFVAGVILAWVIGTCLDLRALSPQERLTLFPLALGGELAMAALALISVPFGLSQSAILPRRDEVESVGD